MTHEIAVVSKKGCHLCENAIMTVELLNERSQLFDLKVLYVEASEELSNLYLLKVPVVRVDGIDVLEAEDIAITHDCQEKLGALFEHLNKS